MIIFVGFVLIKSVLFFFVFFVFFGEFLFLIIITTTTIIILISIIVKEFNIILFEATSSLQPATHKQKYIYI